MNLIANADFRQGGSLPEGWACGKAAGFGCETGAGPAGGRCLSVSGPEEEVTLRQTGLVLIPGEAYRLSAWIRTEAFTDPSRARVILIHPGTRWRAHLEPARETAGWSRYDAVCTPAPVPDPRYNLVIAVQKGPGRVQVADIALEPLSSTAHAAPRSTVPPLAISPRYAAVPEGGSVALTLHGAPPAASLRLAVHGPDYAAATDLEPGTGPCRYRFEAASVPAHGLYTVTAFHRETAAFAVASIDRLSRATCAAFGQAADAAALVPPAHLLFLGDSLTDFHRGCNYVDKVAFWLQRRHGPGITVRNAGVGGDFVTRVWDRLTQSLTDGKPAHRAHMYDALYRPMPTHVFIFLGHNDSKLTHASGYTTGFVPLPLFEDCYRRIVRRIRADTGARITLLSTMSSFYDTAKANADKARAGGGTPNLFGKPEALERYNAAIRTIAAGEGCGFIDVYTPSRRHPDKRSLFMPGDGVHISNQGNELVALELLAGLARRA